MTAKIPAGRLLPHVVEATAYAGQLGAATGTSIRVLNNVAVELMRAGQLGPSRPLLDRALSMAQAHLGPNHPETLTTRSNLASVLGEVGQVHAAATQFSGCWTTRSASWAPTTPTPCAPAATWPSGWPRRGGCTRRSPSSGSCWTTESGS